MTPDDLPKTVPLLADLPPAAAPVSDCELCAGTGLVVAKEGERTIARACTCIPDCERCRGLGQVTAITDDGVRTGRCSCQRVLDRARLLSAAHIPGRYAHATLGTFMQGARQWGERDKMQATITLTRWLRAFRAGEENRGLIFHGAVGRGKTHLLVALVRELVIQHGVHARFVEFSRLLAQLKAGYSAGRSDSVVLDPLVSVPVLAIDELGKGRMTDWELTIIDELVSRRYNAMACTLGSTNFRPAPATGAEAPNAAMVELSPQTLGDRVGDRVLSRLQQMSTFVELKGRDFRTLPSR